MSVITRVVVDGRACECQFEIELISSERSTIDTRLAFQKRAIIRKLCTSHELDIRKKQFSKLKKNHIAGSTNQDIETMQNYLNDLSNEIPNT